MKPPDKLKHNAPKWLENYLEALRLYCIAITPIKGPGINISEEPRGTLLSADFSGTPQETVPFHCYPQGGKLRVVRGTVNSFQPTGMFPGDAPPLLMTIVNAKFICLELTLDYDADLNAWTITAAAIVLKATFTSTEVDGSSTKAYMELGTIGAAGQITSNRVGTLSFERAGNDDTWTDTFWGRNS